MDNLRKPLLALTSSKDHPPDTKLRQSMPLELPDKPSSSLRNSNFLSPPALKLLMLPQLNKEPTNLLSPLNQPHSKYEL